MAKIIDQERQETVEETTQEPVQEELTLDQAVVSEEPQQPQPDEVEELPEKYKNKSAQELVQMHQEAEKLLGRQSSEVGELRKVVDDYIQTQLTKETAPTQTVEEEVDFFTDPEKAVQKAIENHPKIKEAENINQEYRKTTALNQLNNVIRTWSKYSKIQSLLNGLKLPILGLSCLSQRTKSITMKLLMSFLLCTKNVRKRLLRLLWQRSRTENRQLRVLVQALPEVLPKLLQRKFTDDKTLLDL